MYVFRQDTWLSFEYMYIIYIIYYNIAEQNHATVNARIRDNLKMQFGNKLQVFGLVR